jgi:hypothetical protein
MWLYTATYAYMSQSTITYVYTYIYKHIYKHTPFLNLSCFLVIHFSIDFSLYLPIVVIAVTALTTDLSDSTQSVIYELIYMYT